MNANFMFGKEAGEVISERECHICQRTVSDGRASGWCFACFEQWYDGDLSHENGDNRNPLKIANHVRAKHGLPPLTVEQLHPSLVRKAEGPDEIEEQVRGIKRATQTSSSTPQAAAVAKTRKLRA